MAAIASARGARPSPVTLSSGEAEFYGLVKASGAGLGHQSLLKDLGLDVPLCVWTDASAALGLATRSGLGKLRHLETMIIHKLAGGGGWQKPRFPLAETPPCFGGGGRLFQASCCGTLFLFGAFSEFSHMYKSSPHIHDLVSAYLLCLCSL